MKLILHEDEHLLVINKPAGWNTHSPSPYAGEGVYEWLKHREPRWSELAIIHRLDKETSGVLVFGKTTEANRSLTEQFASRAVRKKYLLLTDRPLARDSFAAVSTIVRAGAKYTSQPLRPGGERAETHFQKLSAQPGGHALVEAKPITGRTHQIRVHATEHGFPILGDTLYGGSKARRVFLHAAELSLKHPSSGEELTFRAPCAWSTGEVNEAGHARDDLRDSMFDPQLTNAYRLIHGASDSWPGLYVDRLSEFLLAQSEGALTTSQQALLVELAREHACGGVYHKALSRQVRRTSTSEASPSLVCGQPAPDRFTILENGLTFELSFNEGYSVGLFLDQRDNRRRLLTNHIAAGFPIWPNEASASGVLNVFAYTCGFSVAAAKAGAHTTSLDLSRKYLEWGKRNFAANGIGLSGHNFIYGDAFDWLRRLTRKHRTFDVIALDPPTFSQSKESGVWQAEKHYGRLITAALPLLKRNGVFFASTNATRLEPQHFLEAIRTAVTSARRRILQQHYVPQPPDFSISREEPAYLKTVWQRIE